MGIERLGRQFIELVDEDGYRRVVRIDAIQQAGDVDELQDEAYLMSLIRSSLDKLK